MPNKNSKNIDVGLTFDRNYDQNPIWNWIQLDQNPIGIMSKIQLKSKSNWNWIQFDPIKIQMKQNPIEIGSKSNLKS